MSYRVKRISAGGVGVFVCWFGFLFVFCKQILRVDDSLAKALIALYLLLIWWENNYGEENKEPSRQWERENHLAVRAGQELLQLCAFRVLKFY